MDVIRHARIQAMLQAQQTDALICWRPDELVLTLGYYPQWGTSFCLYPREGAPVLFNPVLEPRDRLPDGLDVREYPWGASADPWSVLIDGIKSALKERGLAGDVIGFIPAAAQSTPPVNSAEGQPIPPEFLQRLMTISAAKDVTEAFNPLYTLKTPAEVERIRLAHRVAASGIHAFYDNLRPGKSEAEVASAVESAVLNQMAYDPVVKFARGWAFVQSGVNAIDGGTFSRTTGKRLEAGELVMIELGVCVNGYYADVTRSGAVTGAELQPLHREMFDAVYEAQAEAVAAVAPDVPAVQVDQVARRLIGAYGFSDFFKHHTGHHTGIRYHDPGALIAPGSDLILKPGMVVTIEPGVYGAALGAGCRIEDNVLVTDAGCEILSDFPRELNWE
jgi:Xaa-Pro dipeptidase